jgi:fatty-acyl-CoA synthase
MFLPTMSFIRRPSIWLEAIHRHRGTITFAPNFAYALATRAVTEVQSKEWDLSCMRALGCGAEPIQADVLRGFVDRFAPNGLKPTSVLPSYGMAEATLAISFFNLADTLKTDIVEIDSMRAGVARKVDSVEGNETHGRGMELVACGRAFPNHEIKIADTNGTSLGDRRVGEVWVKGPSVTKGYFGDAIATEETFGGGWLRTGDLGYLDQGELYICDRAKDLIILNGKNYYPQDIEAVVSKVPGVRDGQCVAFSVLSDRAAEHCVIVTEAKPGPRAGTAAEIITQIIQAIRAEIGIVPGEVHLIKRGTLPKTSSGKVRRREARRRLEAGELEFLTDADSGIDSLPPAALSENVPAASHGPKPAVSEARN